MPHRAVSQADYQIVMMDREFSVRSLVISTNFTILSFLLKYAVKNFRSPGRCCVLNVPIEFALSSGSAAATVPGASPTAQLRSVRD